MGVSSCWLLFFVQTPPRGAGQTYQSVGLVEAVGHNLDFTRRGREAVHLLRHLWRRSKVLVVPVGGIREPHVARDGMLAYVVDGRVILEAHVIVQDRRALVRGWLDAEQGRVVHEVALVSPQLVRRRLRDVGAGRVVRRAPIGFPEAWELRRGDVGDGVVVVVVKVDDGHVDVVVERVEVRRDVHGVCVRVVHAAFVEGLPRQVDHESGCGIGEHDGFAEGRVEG